MNDDFNTGGAVGALFELLTTLNRFADTRRLEEPNPPAEAVADFRRGVVALRELGQILGLFRAPPARAGAGGDQLVQGLVQVLIDLRETLRAEAKQVKDADLKKKLFGHTDTIRSRLKDLGVTLEDRPGGTGWRIG
jgi:cysteinyl-tRNA synthetase